MSTVHCSSAAAFLHVLECFNFIQHVDFSTHKSGHTLDLLCSVGIGIDQLTKDEVNFSDHKLLTSEFTISASLQSSKQRVISFRNIRNIDPERISNPVAELPVLGSIDCYNSALSSIVVAPVKERVVSFSKSSPWYTNDLRALKVEGRKIERLYKKSGLTVHKLMFEQHQLQYHLALKTSREVYYSHVINKGAANPRTLFKTIDSLLKSQKKTICPSDEMCNNFNKYFKEKVQSIYSSISFDSPLLTSESYSKDSPSTALSNFTTVNVDNVLN